MYPEHFVLWTVLDGERSWVYREKCFVNLYKTKRFDCRMLITSIASIGAAIFLTGSGLDRFLGLLLFYRWFRT